MHPADVGRRHGPEDYRRLPGRIGRLSFCSPTMLRNCVTLLREDLSLATSFSERMRLIRYFGSEEFYEPFLYSCIVHSADGRAEPAAYRRTASGQSRQARG